MLEHTMRDKGRHGKTVVNSGLIGSQRPQLFIRLNYVETEITHFNKKGFHEQARTLCQKQHMTEITAIWHC